MSNYLYGGYQFKNELVKYFRFRNLEAPLVGETQQMLLSLLNSDNKGYSFGTNSFYSSEPTFSLDYIIYNPATDLFTSTNLLKYNPLSSIFEFNKGLDLKNASRISNSLDPVLAQDLVTKSFLQNSIGGFGSGSVTSVGLTTSTSGLSISGSPITTSGIFNINLSTQLQNFSSLSSLGLINKVAGNSFNTIAPGLNGQALVTNSSGGFSFTNVGTVTSIGIAGGTGVSVSGSPIISSGIINLSLSSNLQALSSLATNGIIYKSGSNLLSSVIPATDGQIPTSSGGGINWVTPATGGNITGASVTTVNALMIWGNSVGTNAINSTMTIDTFGNLNLGNKKATNAANPTSAQDLGTKSYIDTAIAVAIANISHGMIVLDNVGSGTLGNMLPVGVTKAKVTIIGGGGGGASSAPGGGGGSGATMIAYIINLSSSTPYTVGAGGAKNAAGGDSIFGSGSDMLTAMGGRAGSNAQGGLGGVGVGTTGPNVISLLIINGARGENPPLGGSSSSLGGNGGGSILGGAGTGAFSPNSYPATAGVDNTGGGGGGAHGANSASSAAGGSGVIIIEW